MRLLGTAARSAGPTHFWLAVWLTVGGVLVAAPQAMAQPKALSPTPVANTADTTGWVALTASQRQTLAPLAKDWAGMEQSQRAKWLELAGRFPAMGADEQQRVQQRMAEWSRLSPAERGRARLTFQENKQLSAEEKQTRWQAYQALPEHERQQLTARGQQQVKQPVAPPPAKPTPLDLAQPKQNLVAKPAMAAPVLRPVAPTVVQNKPGATTTLMNKPPTPPRHQQPGEPKIAARPSQVNSSTLLPKTGPQQAAAAAALPASRPTPQ